jgi:protein-L-isoaspartate(D-aspartate) O-methyltransferase
MDAGIFSQDETTDPYALARDMMVDSQVRPNRVTDSRLLAAMRAVPRELFVPENRRAQTYLDTDIPLGHGRAVIAPMAIAKLLQLGMPKPGQKALVAGAGTGYAAALLAHAGVLVTLLEDSAPLLSLAREAFAATGLSQQASFINGPLAEGYAANAPYDLILIEGAIAAIPASLAAQLIPGTGRLVTVISGADGVGKAVLAETSRSGLHRRAMFDCAVTPLPALRPEASFTF